MKETTVIDETRLRQELDADQCRAALQTEGPMLILAGAGSGKTRAITFKIAHLISAHGVDARRILAVTFTNKAAREMRERIQHLLGTDVALDWMGTFHAICVRILRLCLDRPAIGRHLGWSYSRHFSIYDEDDQRRLLREVAQPQLGDLDAGELRQLAARISRIKNSLLTITDAAGSYQVVQTPERYRERGVSQDDRLMAELYADYQNRLMAADAMDFDDLLLRAVELFQKLPAVAAQFAERFRYVFVDEYQDTNDVQYALLKSLVAPQGNITVVGDDDQSIYGWRGANIEIIRNFHRDFAPVHIVKLERNYRSTGLIVRGAGSVIACNERPPEMRKQVYSQLEDGEPIRIYHVSDDRGEAEAIAEHILRRGSDSYGDTAVFYRTNAQSRALEKALSDRRIPCRIYGGIRFWDRKEVRDILAYLRLLVNERDDAAFLRVINTPSRGIGKTTIEELTAQMNGQSLWQTLSCVVENHSGRAASKLRAFYDMIVALRAARLELPMPLLAEKIIEVTGYELYLRAEDPSGVEDRLGNLSELINALREYEEEHPQGSLDEFLQEIALLTEADHGEDSGGRVTLMTIHMAKGLEFDCVHIAGCDEGVFPLMRRNVVLSEKEKKAHLEEERRLFYVGATRARRYLHLYTTGQRFWQGSTEFMRPSRFLDELDESTVIREHQAGSFSVDFSAFGRSRPSPTIRRVFRDKPLVTSQNGAEAQAERRIVSEGYSQENLYFKPGMRVQHGRFGVGVVRSVAGFGGDARVEVQFRDGVVRKLVLKYANLNPLDEGL